jgi:K+-transporting ATPase ATPase C chain
MLQELRPALRMLVIFTALTGIAYPFLTLALCQWWFPDQANGSLIRAQGRVVGSHLLGQPFTGAGYFHPRPAAVGSGDEGLISGAANVSPANPAFIAGMRQAARQFRQKNPLWPGPIPADLLTSSDSGLDPDISPDAALAQAARVAQARRLPLAPVQALVRRHIQGRQWGVLGEPRVNVLELNLDLLRLAASATQP